MQKLPVVKIYVISLLATIIMLLLFGFLNYHFDGSIWNRMQISKSALTAEYCELNQTNKLFHQTMNTYSNLGYYFLGIIVVLISFHDKKNKTETRNLIQQFPEISFLFGCCLVYLCFTSAFFHASLTWLGQRFDMNGTYSICITLLGISFYKLFLKYDASSNFKRIFIFILLIVIVGFVGFHLIIPSIILLPFLILLIMILTAINYLKNKENYSIHFALLSLLLMLAAFALRTIDVMKIACDPTSMYQGHAVWHFFTGMSGFLLYWFYRSEKVVAKNNA